MATPTLSPSISSSFAGTWFAGTWPPLANLLDRSTEQNRKPVGKAAGDLRLVKATSQFFGGDVSEDGDVGPRSSKRLVTGEDGDVTSAPGLADDRADPMQSRRMP